MAQALAEQRRANAIAREQEMKAEVALNRAGVFLAEAEVPRAMADAFRRAISSGSQRRSGNGRPSVALQASPLMRCEPIRIVAAVGRSRSVRGSYSDFCVSSAFLKAF